MGNNDGNDNASREDANVDDRNDDQRTNDGQDGAGQGTDDRQTDSAKDEGKSAPKPKDHREKKRRDDSDDNGDDSDSDDDRDDSNDDNDADLNEDDDSLPSRVRRQIKAKNRENKRLRERATSAELRALRYEVAEKSGLPLNFAKRLTGTTEDELVADATALIEDFGLQGRVSPSNLPAGNTDGRADRRPVPNDLDAIANRIYARNS